MAKRISPSTSDVACVGAEYVGLDGEANAAAKFAVWAVVCPDDNCTGFYFAVEQVEDFVESVEVEVERFEILLEQLDPVWAGHVEFECHGAVP